MKNEKGQNGLSFIRSDLNILALLFKGNLIFI